MHDTVVTVGTFDGVHLGHRAVLDELARRATRSGRTSVLLTFEPHPLAVVNPAAAPTRLTTALERLEQVPLAPVDRMVVLHFDRTMAARSAEEFVDQILLQRFGMREMVVGHDHGLGRGRAAGTDELIRLGSTRGFPVDVVGPVTIGGHAISSTSIRRAIAGGDLDGAARQLGRRYTLSSAVQRGERRGRQLGFPTANLVAPADKLLPPDGVYAALVETSAGRFGAMMNQGHRPTFDDGRRLIELHLFGFDGDLYDRTVRIEWVAPLRAIRRFESLAALREQLMRDRDQACAALAHHAVDLDAPIAAPE